MARIAKSLGVERAEANAMAPDRSKASDGWLGDPAHASRPSRHNENNAGVVCAWDGTNDPAAGFPVHTIMRWLATNVLRPLYLAGIRQATAPEPWNNVAYFITADETMGWSTGWLTVPYRGANRHLKHGHAGVGVGPDSEPRPPYDSSAAWGLARAMSLTPEPLPDPEDLTMGDISTINARLDALGQQVAALTDALQAMASDGAYDYTPTGGDTNAVGLERQNDGTAAVVQRTFADGAWRVPLVLGRGYILGTQKGPLVRGRRLDFYAQRDTGGVDCFTFDPDFPGPDPDLDGWSVAELPAV